MPEISARSLVLIIQAVDREINRLAALPDEAVTAAELVQLVDYESLADELQQTYEKAAEGQTNLPTYDQLVIRRK